MGNELLEPALRERLQSDIGLDVAQLMSQTALLAVRHDRITDAECVVDGLRPVFGDHAAVGMVAATVASAAGRPLDALEIVDRLVLKFPGFSGIRGVKAMLKKELGQTGWQELAEQVLREADDESAVALAGVLLGDRAARGSRRAVPSVLGTGLRFSRTQEQAS